MSQDPVYVQGTIVTRETVETAFGLRDLIFLTNEDAPEDMRRVVAGRVLQGTFFFPVRPDGTVHRQPARAPADRGPDRGEGAVTVMGGGSAWECGCGNPEAHAGDPMPAQGMVKVVREDGHVAWMPPPGPTIVGTIRASSQDGYTHLEFTPEDGYRTPAVLYAWSDGVVTWREER